MRRRQPKAIASPGRPDAAMPGWWRRVTRPARAFRAFDDRLAERLERSRACTAFATSVAGVCSLLIIAVYWRMRVSLETKLEVTIFFVIVLLALAPIARRRMRTQLANRRRKAGQCVSCGYDRRRSPYYCPECGASE